MFEPILDVLSNATYQHFPTVSKIKFEDYVVYLDKNALREWVKIANGYETIYMSRGLFETLMPKAELSSNEDEFEVDLPCTIDFDNLMDPNSSLRENPLPLLVFALEYGNTAILNLVKKEFTIDLRHRQAFWLNSGCCGKFTRPLSVELICKILELFEYTEQQLLWLDAIIFDSKFAWCLTDENTRMCLHKITDLLDRRWEKPIDKKLLNSLAITNYLPASLVIEETDERMTFDEDAEDLCRFGGVVLLQRLIHTHQEDWDQGKFDKIKYTTVSRRFLTR